MKTIKTLAILAIIVIGSCTSDKAPSELQGKEDLQLIFKEVSDPYDLIIVQEFYKTTGLTKKINENDYYIMEFTSKIIYALGGWINTSNSNAPAFFRKIIEYSPIEFEVNNVFDGFELDQIGDRYTYLEQGATLNINGKLIYEKTEKGWRTASHEFNGYEIISNEVDLSQWENKEYYDNFLGTWQADKSNAYFNRIIIRKEDDNFFVTFETPAGSHEVELWIKNRKFCFYDLDIETCLTYWTKSDKLIIEKSGTYHRVIEPVSIDSRGIYSMNADFLIGEWGGYLDNKGLTVFISKIENGLVSGYNQVGSNRRNVSGELFIINIKTFNAILKEPGDHKWDGVFNLTFINVGETWEGNGTWKSYDEKLNRSVAIKK